MGNTRKGLFEDRKIVETLDKVTRDFSASDIQLLKEILANNHGTEMELLLSLMNYTYRHVPVPVRQFIEEPPYLNLKGQVYPVLLDDLEEMFDGEYEEAILAGSIGWGKSTFAEIAMCRMIYEVSCFKNPQKALGLMDGSVVAFVNVSLSRDAAKKVVFQGLKSKLLNSDYFKKEFPITHPLAQELRLMNNVWVFPVASGEHSILGYNIFGGVMDEVNFMAYVEDSKRSAGDVYDQADKLQTALIRRMKSRYMKRGKLPGILLQVSSAAYPDDYTEKRIKEAQENPETKIFWRRYSQWDTPPPDKYCGERFRLSLGNLTDRPMIITCDLDFESAKEKGHEVIEVPIEYLDDFKKEIDSSIRDLAGLPTLTIHPFIVYREKVMEAMERGQNELELEHPFTKEITTLEDGASFDSTKLLIPKLKRKWENAETEEDKQRYKTIYTKLKQKPRYIHIDLARTTMGGIAMGYVDSYKEVIRRNENGEEYTMRMPVIVIEFQMRIVAPQHGEIQISNVRSLVHELRSYGYRIAMVTFDQYQSVDSQQQFIQKGIDSGQISADGNPSVYLAYKDAIYEDRLLTYWYEPTYWETIRLEKNEKTGKVDHPKGGSKDVSDAVAGVCFLCVEHAPSAPAAPPMYGKMQEDELTTKDSYKMAQALQQASSDTTRNRTTDRTRGSTLHRPDYDDEMDWDWVLKK